MENNQKLTVNTKALIRHISYRLHTLVRTWPAPARPGTMPDRFCARKDYDDTILTEDLFFQIIREWSGTDSFRRHPLLFSINRNICYAFIPSSKTDFLAGPVRFPSPVHFNQDISAGISDPKAEQSAAICDFSDFTSLVLLLHNLTHDSYMETDDLVTASCMDSSDNDAVMERFSSLVFDRREQEQPHNPYDQELREFTAIELGDTEMLRKSLQEDYTGTIGTLARDKVRNMRNRGIVVITLASRAAIRGGLLPEIAFSMSDTFIQKLEDVTDTAVLLNMMHQFEFQYAEKVAELNDANSGRSAGGSNPRIEQCKDYIFRHLHGKISVQDIAEEVFLNPNYLSELFRQQEGITLTAFILKEKVNLTKNLLIYSPYTYSEIAAYLGFSSQSHLGKTFKKYTGLTMKQYRDRYGVRGFF